MKRIGLAAAAVVLMVGGIAATAGPAAQAGQAQPSVRLQFTVFDENGAARTIVDGLTPELFHESGTGGDVFATECGTTPTTTGSGAGIASDIYFCGLPFGDDYTIGLSGLPDDMYVEGVFCFNDQVTERIDDPGAAFTSNFGLRCDVNIRNLPSLIIDKVVNGGPLTASDFVIEVFQDSAPVATVVDQFDAECGNPTGGPSNTSCVRTPLLPGDYDLGEEPQQGYLATDVNCSSEFSLAEDQFPGGQGSFSHAVEGENTYCVITNTYFEQTVSVDIVIDNSDGGTATAADFTIEIWDGDTLVDSGVDPELGEGNASAEFTLPIGDYTFGVDGPDGYESTIVVTIVDLSRAPFPGGTGAFTLSPSASASAVISANDPTTTTTTTAPTTAAPTTEPPTTVATTTTIDGATSPVLPATGDDDTGVLALLALAFVLFGGGIVALTRRG